MKPYMRYGRTEWLLAGILAVLTAFMVVYPPSMWWDLVGQALAVGYYAGLRACPDRRSGRDQG